MFNEQHDVAYRDVGGTIWDAWYDAPNSQWNLQQLNLGDKTQGQEAAGDPCVSVYGEQQHFAYSDRRGIIWDAWYDGGDQSWNLQQINSGTLNNSGVTRGTLAIGGLFVWVYNDQQHFTYRDISGGIWDAWFAG